MRAAHGEADRAGGARCEAHGLGTGGGGGGQLLLFSLRFCPKNPTLLRASLKANVTPPFSRGQVDPLGVHLRPRAWRPALCRQCGPRVDCCRLLSREGLASEGVRGTNVVPSKTAALADQV